MRCHVGYSLQIHSYQTSYCLLELMGALGELFVYSQIGGTDLAGLVGVEFGGVDLTLWVFDELGQFGKLEVVNLVESLFVVSFLWCRSTLFLL